MVGVAPAVNAALESTGRAEADFALMGGLSSDAAEQAVRLSLVKAYEPDVIVILISHWEWLNLSAPGSPVDVIATGWEQTDRSEILDLWVQALTDSSEQVIWILSPPFADEEATLEVGLLNGIYRQLPARFDEVDVVDGATMLSGPDGAFVEFGLDHRGELSRLRHIDGTHFCPDGSVRIAAGVMSVLSEHWGIEATPGWEEGEWRTEDRSWNGRSPFSPQDCPAP